MHVINCHESSHNAKKKKNPIQVNLKNVLMVSVLNMTWHVRFNQGVF